MNLLQKAAEILVEGGYAESIGHDPNYQESNNLTVVIKDCKRVGKVNPFDDALEGRRQADAIEDWLVWEWAKLWHKDSARAINSTEKGKAKPNHQWRLDRVRWCIDQLLENDNKQK